MSRQVPPTRPVPRPAKHKESASVVIDDPLAIRALAHPARMIVIEALYAAPVAMTATQLAERAELSPSAMSYHLRSLERYGIVRRSSESHDGREQPWVRAGASLNVAPRANSHSRAGRTAAGALIAAAMDRDRNSLMAAYDRKLLGDRSVALDAAAGFTRNQLVLTVSEAKKLNRDLGRLIEPFLEENRPSWPGGAGKVNLSFVVVPDVPSSRRANSRVAR